MELRGFQSGSNYNPSKKCPQIPLRSSSGGSSMYNHELDIHLKNYSKNDQAPKFRSSSAFSTYIHSKEEYVTVLTNINIEDVAEEYFSNISGMPEINCDKEYEECVLNTENEDKGQLDSEDTSYNFIEYSYDHSRSNFNLNKKIDQSVSLMDFGEEESERENDNSYNSNSNINSNMSTQSIQFDLGDIKSFKAKPFFDSSV